MAEMRNSFSKMAEYFVELGSFDKNSKRSMIRFYVIQTEGHSLEASFPDYSEKLLGRSTVFSTVLYLVRTKNIEQGYISSKFQKKNKKT